MTEKKKAVLLGDYTSAPYHPLKGVDTAVEGIFEDVISVYSTGDYECLSFESLSRYDLCICYTDCWGGKVTQSRIGGLLSFVAGGGGLLIIHNGISLQNNNEFALLAGAKFTGHPPWGSLGFRVVSPDHPVMDGISGFEMDEEPYRFDFCNFSDMTVLLEYSHEGEFWPAAWAGSFGMGKVVYLMPGHNLDSFKKPAYRDIILRSGLWACGML